MSKNSLPQVRRGISTDIDAIVLVTGHSAESAKNALTLAAATGTLLVTLSSQESKTKEIAELARLYKNSAWLGIDFPDNYKHELLDFQTSVHPGAQFARKIDVTKKRNFALTLAKILGWNKILFLDDDIQVSLENFVLINNNLDNLSICSLSVPQSPDYSTVGMAWREYGGTHSYNSVYSHISVGVMGVRIPDVQAPFPDVYNDDVLFACEAFNKSSCEVLSYALQHASASYNPYRAAAEEFGDLLGDHLYISSVNRSLESFWLNEGTMRSLTDEAYWDNIIDGRKYHIYQILETLHSSIYEYPFMRQRAEDATIALEEALKRYEPNTESPITPESLVTFIQAYLSDVEKFQVDWKELRGRYLTQAVTANWEFYSSRPNIEAALQGLGITSYDFSPLMQNNYVTQNTPKRKHVPYFKGARNSEEEAVLIAQALVQIDTSKNEIVAARLCRDLLTEAGYKARLIAPEDRPQNPNLVAWIPGEGDEDDALLVHGHLDTVDAAQGDWPHPPTAGVIEQDHKGVKYLHGLGSMDNKGPVAATIAALRKLARAGQRPKRHIRFIAFAGEEKLNRGSQFLMDKHPEVFDDVSDVQALEYGGFNENLRGERVYVIHSGENGDTHATITLHGTGAHGALRNRGAIIVPQAMLTIAIEQATNKNTWGGEIPLSTLRTLRDLGTVIGHEFNIHQPPSVFLDKLNEYNPMFAELVQSASQHVMHPVPAENETSLGSTSGESKLKVAMRTLPGQEEDAYAKLEDLVKKQELRWQNDGYDVEASITFDTAGLKGYINAPESRVSLAMSEAIKTVDKKAAAVIELPFPFGTLNKDLLPLNCDSYTGICPMRFPDDYNPLEKSHVVGERIPVDALKFATRTLSHGFRIDPGKSQERKPGLQPAQGRNLTPGYPQTVTKPARRPRLLQTA